MAVTPGGVAAGPREGQAAWHPFADPARREELLRLSSTYAAWRERTAEGELVFRGTGHEGAAQTDRRMIREWARVTALEAEEGARGDFGLVLTWHRGAPSGGACEQLSAYLTGEVLAGACGEPPSARRSLDAERLRRLYGWYDELAPFQASEQKAGGQPADAVLERVHFAGRGRRAATRDETAAIRSLAGSVFGELTAPPRTPPPPPAAQSAAQAPPPPTGA